MNAKQRKELALINARGCARGWHAEELQRRATTEGTTMADLFAARVQTAGAFVVPPEAIRILRNRVLYRFQDGSEMSVARRTA